MLRLKLSRIAITMVLSAFLLFSSISFADTLKVGVVDTHVLLENYVKEVDVQTILDREFFAKDEVLIRKRDEIETVRKALVEASPESTTEEDRRVLERKILNLEREFVRLNDEFRQEFNLRKNEELYKIQKTINDTILNYARENHYDLILEAGVIYSEKNLNVTNKIFKALVDTIEK